jgi:hypothetical protein
MRARGSRATWLALGTLAVSAMFATSIFAVLPDSGTVDVQVDADSDPCATDTTTAGAIATYLSEDDPCGDLGASGTGIFESFHRLQASPNEEGFNTDTNKVLDNVDGNWTHSILVSDIPVVGFNGQLYWELYSDINEGNGNDLDASHISINDIEVYFSDDPGLTDLSTADLQYDFEGDILINDVNSGSGRADLRYLIPIANIDIPTDCSFKNPACELYFVLYTQWGLSEGFETENGNTSNYPSDSGFEEWKVKNYPYVTVSKTADATFTRTFNWTIDKSVTPDTWDLFRGDTGTSQYTVSVDKDSGTDSDAAVSGTITIDNPGELDAVITSVDDVVSGVPTTADVDCGVTFPYTLAAGGTLECTYSADLPDPTDQTNTATVILEAGTTFTGTAAVDFGDPTTVVNDSIHVTDSVEGALGEFTGDDSVTYEKTFACDADEGTHDNTATIDELPDQSASASVDVNCYALGVSKDADTSLTRMYTWSILKSSDDINGHALILNPGETYNDYPYEITVDLAGQTDGGFAVSGGIDVHNPAPISAVINSVTDVISGPISADVDCGVTFPYTLAADGTLSCTYSADLPDDTTRTNTATATLQNHDYDWEDPPVESGTTDFSGTASVDFTNATLDEVDECIDVTDTFQGALGTVCVGDPLPKTFTYTRTFGPFTADECGDHTFDNTASFETNDTSATGESSWQVVVTVPCPGGCTLTQGYWKTHSIYGPAKKADPTWDLLANGPDTTFFLSGQTWYQVFWTAPKKGNAYYILAHQYEAAKLNILAGASSTADVDAAITWAETFFNTYTPANWPKGLKNEIVSTAGVLGSYNEGLTGPGHCSEDGSALAGNLASSSSSTLR